MTYELTFYGYSGTWSIDIEADTKEIAIERALKVPSKNGHTIHDLKSIKAIGLRVVRTGQIDIDSTNFDIYEGEDKIGYGHLNNSTNFVHITLHEQDDAVKKYLVDAIKNRTINIE